MTKLSKLRFDDEERGENSELQAFDTGADISNYLRSRKKKQTKRQAQKRGIKKKYATQVRQKKAAASRRIIVSQTQRTAVWRQKSQRSLVIALIVLLLAGFCLNCVNGCSMLLQGGLSALGGSTYPSQDEDMLKAEAAYAAGEDELKSYLADYENTHNYDEYHFELDEIGHDPYVLISLLTAYMGGEWKFAGVEELIEDLFDRQYLLVERVEMEVRSDDEGNNYPWYVCYVELYNRDLAQQTAILTGDKLEIYALYMRTLGNRPDLFDKAEYPNASVIEPPLVYEIPPEVMADEIFAAMITEAEKYLGYPYVWGGSNPNTSFDCSGFVCWVINHTEGLPNVGRTTANGLRNLTVAVSPNNARPGDLVFFKDTYANAPKGASHVGIYVGNGMMIHCGSPISYADITDRYWQNHLLGFGRLDRN